MIKLASANEADEKQFKQMMLEWHRFGGRINPGVLRRFDSDYMEWLCFIRTQSTIDKSSTNQVPSSTYLVFMDEALVGAVNIRHYLDDELMQSGGHIAYGIRPSFRGKGLAKAALSLALDKCHDFGIVKVLLTCDKDNLASAKVIRSQGGILENEFMNAEGKLEQRYWISINDYSSCSQDCIRNYMRRF